jgi:hypothetical protein
MHNCIFLWKMTKKFSLYLHYSHHNTDILNLTHCILCAYTSFAKCSYFFNGQHAVSERGHHFEISIFLFLSSSIINQSIFSLVAHGKNKYLQGMMTDVNILLHQQ